MPYPQPTCPTTPVFDLNAAVIRLDLSEHHTRTLVRRPLHGDLSAWQGVTENWVLISTVLLPVAWAHERRWETMAFPVSICQDQMLVNYTELVARRAPDRASAERHHTELLSAFSAGQYGSLCLTG